MGLPTIWRSAQRHLARWVAAPGGSSRRCATPADARHGANRRPKSGSSTHFGATTPPTHRAASASARCAPLRLIQIVQENIDQLFQHLAIRCLHGIAAAHDIRWQSDQGATRLAVVEVVSGEIGVNDALRSWLARHPFDGTTWVAKAWARRCKGTGEQPQHRARPCP